MTETGRRRRGPDQGHRDAVSRQGDGSTLTEARIREIAREEMRRMLGRLVDDGATVYSTRRGRAPAEWSEETWRAVAPTIPGAYKPPGSRWTIVPRAAFDAWVARQGGTPAASTPPPATAPKPSWTPADSALAMGLRRVGGDR